MARFVIKRRGGQLDNETTVEIQKTPGVKVIDQFSPNAILIEATEEGLVELQSMQADWIIEKEVEYRLPGKPDLDIQK